MADAYLMKVVGEDLAHLALLKPSADSATLRNCSGILRRLVLDDGGLLPRARKASGGVGEFRIDHPSDLDSDLVHYGVAMRWATAGGQRVDSGWRLGGLELDPSAALEQATPPAYVTPDGKIDVHSFFRVDQHGRTRPRPAAESQPLQEFLGATSVVVDGTGHSPMVVIRYLANKLGGVHLDVRRSRKRDADYELLDTAIDNNEDRRIQLFFEVLGIAHLIANSNHAEELMGRASE